MDHPVLQVTEQGKYVTDFSNNYRAEAIGTPSYGDLLQNDSLDLVLTSDADARGTNNVAQDVLQRLSSFQGECFVATDIGVPYFQQLIGQKAPASTWDAVLQAEVLQTPGVQQLTYWQSTPNYKTRQLQISFRAVTQTGVVSYNGSLNLAIS